MKNIYIPTPSTTLNPKWTGRNISIASMIPEQMSILDLGCGSKDLLRYIKSPKKYLGVDYNQPLADLSINFNDTFSLPTDNWDYVTCSGLLEYLLNVDNFFKQITHLSQSYIFTFYKSDSSRQRLKNPNTIKSVADFEKILNANFQIVRIKDIKTHFVYVCKDIA
jgi:SAM-dependent methyltransferase